MGEKVRGHVRKEAVLFFAFAIFIISLAGCETTKGAIQGGAEGASRDWENAKGLWAGLQKADAWVQKNLW